MPAIVHQVLHSSGQPLDPATRSFMESRFGQDFSKVRVHTDAQAAASAHAVNALAYTVGDHVVFGAGQYVPTTFAGRRLLAHELTHVVQQANEHSPSRGTVSIAPQESEAEREAERLADQILAGAQASDVRATLSSVHLQRAVNEKLWFPSTWQGKPDEVLTFGGAYATPVKAEYTFGGSSRPVRFSGTLTNNVYSGSYEWETRAGGLMRGSFSFVMEGTGALRGKLNPDPGFSQSNWVLNRVGGLGPTPPPPPPIKKPEEKKTEDGSKKPPPPPAPAPEEKVCGPNVTTALENTLRQLHRDFNNFSRDKAYAKCARIVGGASAIKSSWEIEGLVDRPWYVDARKARCSQPGAPKEQPDACDWSVQVGNVCQNVYTPNYALFGTMCRLCADRFSEEGVTKHERMPIILRVNQALKWLTSRYIWFIDAHQYEWAMLAYRNRGWHRGLGTPGDDYPVCKTRCEMPFPSFFPPGEHSGWMYRWEPLEEPMTKLDRFEKAGGQGTGINTGQAIKFGRLPGQTASGATHQGTIEGNQVRAIFIGKTDADNFEGTIEIKKAGRTFKGKVKFVIQGVSLTGWITPTNLHNLFKTSSTSVGNLLSFTLRPP